MNEDLAAQIEQQREFGELICQKLIASIEKLGFQTGVISVYPEYQAAQFQLTKDPLTGKSNLSGFWYDTRKQRIGRLQFQSDDSCYAEYDIIQNHPTKKQWFVEKVTAWGKMDALKAEPSLLRLPE